jgi:CRP/FNR family transcriptional regulator, cyclic AMP receptor protein
MRPAASPPLEQLLLSASWMQLLPPATQQRVLADAREKLLEPREIVAHRGEPSNFWIGVAEGLLKASSTTPNGRTVIFAAVPAGSWIGEGSVVKREMRKYELMALRQTRAILIPRPIFMWLLDTHLEFCRFILDMLNERTGQFASMLELSRITDPIGRIAGALLVLIDPALYRNGGPLINISQLEIGELAGLSRTSTNGALTKLRRLNLVSTVYGGLLVLAVDGLRKLVADVHMNSD